MAKTIRKTVPPTASRGLRTPWQVVGATTLIVGAIFVSVAASRQTNGFGVVPKAAAEARARVESQEKIRRVEHRTNRKITDELRAEDQIVEVEDWRPAGLAPLPPDGQTPVEYLTKLVPVVAVLRVTDVEGRISKNGLWVDSTVRSELVEVLKSPPDVPLYNGSSISFVSPGGEAKLGTQTIRVRTRDSGFFEVGHTYLVFIRKLDGAWWATVEEAALLEEATVRPLAASGAHNFGSRNKAAVVAEVNTFAVVRR